MEDGKITDYGTPEQVGTKNKLWDHYVSTSHLVDDD